MSEQPLPNNIHDLSQRRTKADGSLEMGPETDVLLHASSLPRDVAENYTVDRRTSAADSNPEILAIHEAARQVANLNAVRRYEVAA